MASMRGWLRGRRATVARVPAPQVAPRADEPAPTDRRLEVWLAEWQDVRASLRHASSERLGRLALFCIASGALAAGYLATLSQARPLDIVGWALPGLGVAVCLVFVALEAGAGAYRRACLERGRQIELAVQILLPGLGRVKSLALLADFHPDDGGQMLCGSGAPVALYGVVGLAWIAALTAAALGFHALLSPGSGLP
ncbi:MAG: hypothetical protein ACRET2_03785 [Steroidobacteraceae bacterium]